MIFFEVCVVFYIYLTNDKDKKKTQNTVDIPGQFELLKYYNIITVLFLWEKNILSVEIILIILYDKRNN